MHITSFSFRSARSNFDPTATAGSTVLDANEAERNTTWAY